MLAEAGELADPGDAVALAGYRDDAAAALEEDALVGDAPAESGEEGDVASCIDRCDDRRCLLAEAIEAPAARDRVAGAREGSKRIRLAGVRRASRRERGQQQAHAEPDHLERGRAHTAGV